MRRPFAARTLRRFVRAAATAAVVVAGAVGLGSALTAEAQAPPSQGGDYLPFPSSDGSIRANVGPAVEFPGYVPAQVVATTTLTAPSPPPAPKSAALRPLSETVIDTRLPVGGALPTDAAAPTHAPAPNGFVATSPESERRPWMSYEFAWVASNMVHRPLYFEDLNLERYGNSACPALQPAISGARFAAELSLLPYQMTIHRPRECIYLLGYCRPGSKAPNLAYVPPLRLDAAAVEAAAITGAVFIVP